MGLGELSEPHLQAIGREYEALRRRKAYQEPRLTHRFVQSDLTPSLKTAPRELGFEVNFARDQVGEDKWKEYGTQLLKLYQALAKKGKSFPFTIEPKYTYNSLGYRLSTRNDPELIDAIFYPSSLQT